MKQIISILIVLLLCLSVLVGCQKPDPSNANCQIMSDELSSDTLKASFLKENRTSGAYYDGDVALEDNDIPKSRTFIIKTQDEYDTIFENTASVAVDFNSELLILYAFTTEYHRDISLDDWKVEGKTISITYEMKEPGKPVGDAARPFQRFLLIKMNKLDIENAEMIEKK